MRLALGQLGQALLLSSLLLLHLANVPPAQAPPGATAARPNLEAAQAGAAGVLGRTAGLSAPVAVTARDATPLNERRARAVAMTLFSLGSVIGAGVLAGFLIKRLL